MEWQIFAMLQMALIAIGISTAFALRNHALKKQNALLRQHVDSVPVAADPASWAKDYLGSLSDEPTRPLIEAVINNALQPDDAFSDNLAQLVKACGLTTDGDAETLQAQIAELEAQISNTATPDGEQAEELKALLQQFTRDSREMMGCIQELETENAQLRKQLNLPEEGALPEPDADPQVAENTDEADVDPQLEEDTDEPEAAKATDAENAA